MVQAGIIMYFIFDFSGNAGLLLALLTFAFKRSLSQRKNPFLINLFLTTYLSTFPPALLLISGNISEFRPPLVLCMIQSITMDGIAPMFGMALMTLVIQTWSTIRGISLGTDSVVDKHRWLRILMILMPYITFISWCLTSALAAFLFPNNFARHEVVACSNKGSTEAVRITNFIGFFVAGFAVIDIVFESATLHLIYKHFWQKKNYRKNADSKGLLIFRLCLFPWLQILPIVLAFILSAAFNISTDSGEGKVWFRVVESMNGPATFIVFGTTPDLLAAWGLKRPLNVEISHIDEGTGSQLC